MLNCQSVVRSPSLYSLFAMLLAFTVAGCSRGGDSPPDDSAEAPEAAESEESEAADNAEEPADAPPATPSSAERSGNAGRPGSDTLAAAAAETPSALDTVLPCSRAVIRARMARKIVNREPTDTEPPYVANGEQLYVFLEIANEVEGSKWDVTWRHPSSDHSFNQQIEVGVSPAWRTWLRHRIAPEREGEWFVDINAPGGCGATTVAFEVVGAE